MIAPALAAETAAPMVLKGVAAVPLPPVVAASTNTVHAGICVVRATFTARGMSLGPGSGGGLPEEPDEASLPPPSPPELPSGLLPEEPDEDDDASPLDPHATAIAQQMKASAPPRFLMLQKA